MMNSNKKLLTIYILEILKEYSDEEHPMLQNDIINKLDINYNMSCDRKSVGANIQILEDIGYNIVKTGKGVYLGERELENSEISFLIDAIFSSHSIESGQSKKLIDKLMKILSCYKRKNYNYVFNANNVIKTDNKQVFYNIDLLNEAIDKRTFAIFVNIW